MADAGPEPREMRAAPRIWSIVLVHNNFDDTDECLRSLAEQDYDGHSILVVDNGSTDGCVERLREAWCGRAEFLSTGANLGVAGGYNAGIRAALAAGAEYVVLCNNDIVAEPGFVSALRAVFDGESRTAAVAPVMIYYDRPERVWFAGVSQFAPLCLSRNLLRGQSWQAARAQTPSVRSSDYVTTCATMISRAALDDVGLLDERFFFGHDDVDWSLRARRRGYMCGVLGQPLVRHKVSVTSGIRGSNTLSPKAAYTHALGAVLIGAKHYRGAAAPGFLLGLLAVRAPYTIATMLLSGRLASVPRYVRGIVDGFREHGRDFLRAGAPSDADAGRIE